jgi:adenine-specific DNA-methyltransferase
MDVVLTPGAGLAVQKKTVMACRVTPDPLGQQADGLMEVMDEVNACIAASAEPEELVDQPAIDKDVVRVSGPFTVEAVMPAEESLDGESPIGGTPEKFGTFGADDSGAEPLYGLPDESSNAEAYLDKMLRLLRMDGVRFPNNKVIHFTHLEPRGGDYLHAEGEWQTENGQTHTVGVSFGPQFGAVTSRGVLTGGLSAWV